MEYIRVPSIVKRGNHTFKYLEQVNDTVYLYEEEKIKVQRMFLITRFSTFKRTNHTY